MILIIFFFNNSLIQDRMGGIIQTEVFNSAC